MYASSSFAAAALTIWMLAGCGTTTGSTLNGWPVTLKNNVLAEVQVSGPATGGRLVSLHGQVVDSQNKPVANVQVSIAGKSRAITGATGEYQLRVAPAERLAVSFRAAGYMDTTIIFRPPLSRGGNIVVVWPRAVAATLNGRKGGKLAFPGGTVIFPPGALVDRQGRTVRGDVQVALSVLDVCDRQQLRSAPGDFTAVMRDRTVRQLVTFGMFELLVEDSDKQRVNLARGQKVSVQLLIPAALRDKAPDKAGLFSFDPIDGRWVEAGTLVAGQEVASYDVMVTGIGFWNADIVSDTTCIRLKVLDRDCGESPGTASSYVEANGTDFIGISGDYTDSDGYVCLSVKRNTIVDLVAYHPTQAGVQSNPIKITTPDTEASAADCDDRSQCPLVATTHLAYGAFTDPLDANDMTAWCASDGWANDAADGFATGWRADHLRFGSGLMNVTLSDYADSTSTPCTSSTTACSERPYASGEYRSKSFYGYGTYEAKLQAVEGSGLVTTFFTYTGVDDGTVDAAGVGWHDEIDVEIFGYADPAKLSANGCEDTDGLMQANYFVKGTGGNEKLICLSFDPSQRVATYGFFWSATEIKWFVDGAEVYHVTWTDGDPWPTQPGRIVVNMWAGTEAVQEWLGSFTYTEPVTAIFDSISYTP
jgi:beta-glucanase (GH16 family)